MERRAEPRFHVGSKARMFLPEDSRELTAHVINVSGSGLRVLISENLALGQHIVLDLEHHLVAAEACNCEETGGKFAVGLRRLHEVSKLDGHGSADEQIRGLMTEMGWVPGPSLIESSKATEPTASEAPKTVDPEPAAIEVPVVVEPAAPAIELPVVVELAASATAAPQATEPEPPGIDSCEAAGLAPVAMELPKAAEPKPALIEWQVVELNAPAIEFPKAQEPQHAAIELPVVELNAPTIEPFKAPEPHDAATELAVLELAAPVIELPKPPEPQRA
ncbi:MAG TPA: PilZ domain-containing protein, partial [Bryobacteraceae bacterium]|nr:PilZ domain-containing protein [Bryobacteraceae bacterium]